MDKVALNILVGGAWLSDVLPTPFPVSSLNSGSVQTFVFGLNMIRLRPETVNVAL